MSGLRELKAQCEGGEGGREGQFRVIHAWEYWRTLENSLL